MPGVLGGGGPPGVAGVIPPGTPPVTVNKLCNIKMEHRANADTFWQPLELFKMVYVIKCPKRVNIYTYLCIFTTIVMLNDCSIRWPI